MQHVKASTLLQFIILASLVLLLEDERSKVRQRCYPICESVRRVV